MTIRRIAAAVALALFFVAAQASAQSAQESSWGVSGSFVPSWTVPGDSALSKAMFGADALSINGSEFRIGFVRGRTLGGDWGVSFVRRKLNDGSTISSGLYTDPEMPGLEQGEFKTLRNVELTGVEVHKFTPFGTIAKRVQIGVLFGGGVASSKGELDMRTVSVDYRFTGNSMVMIPVETRETLDAKELVFPGNGLVALGRLEVAVAGIVGPGLKLRASGGMAFPGMHTFSIGGVYLIGAK
jgi:hypothetical protein